MEGGREEELRRETKARGEEVIGIEYFIYNILSQ